TRRVLLWHIRRERLGICCCSTADDRGGGGGDGGSQPAASVTIVVAVLHGAMQTPHCLRRKPVTLEGAVSPARLTPPTRRRYRARPIRWARAERGTSPHSVA